MKSNKFLLQQSGQSYLIQSQLGVTEKIGPASTSSSGSDGKSVLTGSGDPSSSVGRDGEVYIDTTNFKLFTKSNGVWSAGSIFKGTDGAAGLSFKGILSSLSDTGNENDTAIYNNLIYKRVAGSWVNQSVSVKGSDGSNGTDGKATYTTTSISDGGSPASNTAYSTTQGSDILIDATNHKIYRRSASGASFTWTAIGGTFKGTVFKGAFASSTGLSGIEGDTAIINNVIHKYTGGAWTSQTTSVKGDQGDAGVGINRYVDALSADTSLTYNSDKQLYFNDVETNTGALLTKTGNLSAGSTFTIASGKEGRYRIDFDAAYKLAPTTNLSSTNVNLEAAIFVSSSEVERATGTSIVGGLVPNNTTRYKTISVSKTSYLRAGSTITVKVNLASNVSNLNVYANAIDKTGDGQDTVITITKL